MTVSSRVVRLFQLFALGRCALDSGTLTPFLVPDVPAAANESTSGFAVAGIPHVRCLFYWAGAKPLPSPPPAATPESGDVARDESSDAANRIAALAGTCTPKVEASGFSYSVCIGSNVTQWGVGDSGPGMHLGSFDAGAATHFRLPLHVQHYSGGARCGATARSARVALGCGTSFAAFGVAEPQTCYYELRVTHPSLCGSNKLLPGNWRLASTQAGAVAPADAPASLPPHLEYRARELRARKGAGGSASPSPPPLSAGDVPGVGGRSLTLKDDSRRGGRRWAGRGGDPTADAALDGGGPAFYGSLRSLGSGLPAGGGSDAVADGGGSTWVLDLHHALLGSRGADAAKRDGAAAASVAAECSVAATDDLRLGTGVDAGRGAVLGSDSAGAGLGDFALVVLRSSSSSSEGSGGGEDVPGDAGSVVVVARGSDRSRVRVVQGTAVAAGDDDVSAAVRVSSSSAEAAAACRRDAGLVAALAQVGAAPHDCALVASGPSHLPSGIEFISAGFELPV